MYTHTNKFLLNVVVSIALLIALSWAVSAFANGPNKPMKVDILPVKQQPKFDITLMGGAGFAKTPERAYQVGIFLPTSNSILKDVNVSWTKFDSNKDIISAVYVKKIGPVSLGGGLAYVPKITDNLTRNYNAYLEVGFSLIKPITCKWAHLSAFTTGDKGDNLWLCGARLTF